MMDQFLVILALLPVTDFNELRWSLATELIDQARERDFETYAYDRAFVGCDRAAFELACRGANHLHPLYEIMRMTLPHAWSHANRVFLNMNLSDDERATIESIQRDDQQPRTVVDIYGSPNNMTLADLPAVTYHGAAW